MLDYALSEAVGWCWPSPQLLSPWLQTTFHDTSVEHSIHTSREMGGCVQLACPNVSYSRGAGTPVYQPVQCSAFLPCSQLLHPHYILRGSGRLYVDHPA